MSRMFRGMFMGIVVLSVGLVASPRVWAQPRPPQPPANLSPVDLAASVSWEQIPPTTGAQVHWTGPGFSLTVNGNVNENLAIAAGVDRFAQGRTAFLTGVQFSTAFFYGSGIDPTPGRWFAKVLGGVADARSSIVRGMGQFDVGADILLSRTLPIGVRGEVGFDLVPGDPIHHTYGRVAVGLLVGPRIRP